MGDNEPKCSTKVFKRPNTKQTHLNVRLAYSEKVVRPYI